MTRGNLPAYGVELQKRYGENIINQLLATKKATAKYSDSEGLAMVEHYKGEVSRLKKLKGLT